MPSKYSLYYELSKTATNFRGKLEILESVTSNRREGNPGSRAWGVMEGGKKKYVVMKVNARGEMIYS